MLWTELFTLLILSIPVACISWTVVREEVFREPREFFVRHSKSAKNVFVRKFFYLFTCEYCFSHYITAIVVSLTCFHILFDDWRGYLIAGFSIVWIANVYMAIFALIRADIKQDMLVAKLEERQLDPTTHQK
ncbi:MAG: hypothetical protein ABI444_06075 [Candidatus Kapaibacterium sp.]|jgi:hypothetical protein